MIYRFICILSLLLIFSCQNKKKVPADVLKPAKMQDVMWDMIRADQYSMEMFLRDSSKKVQPENLNLYNKVFQAHKISNEDFKKSYAYYQKRPDLLHVILDSMYAKQSREFEKQEAKLREAPKAIINK